LLRLIDSTLLGTTLARSVKNLVAPPTMECPQDLALAGAPTPEETRAVLAIGRPGVTPPDHPGVLPPGVAPPTMECPQDLALAGAPTPEGHIPWEPPLDPP
jgi:hypothetical protein